MKPAWTGPCRPELRTDPAPAGGLSIGQCGHKGRAARLLSRAARPPALVAGKPQVGLADGEPGDGPADDQPLDFRGASKMVKLLGLMTHD